MALQCIDRRQRLIDRGGDDDALAGGQPVGFHDHRRAVRADVVLGRLGVVEALIRGGRDGVARAHILHQALGAFQRRRRRARAERLDARLLQPIDQSGDERRFRADDDEIDAIVARETHQSGDIIGRDRHQLGLARDAGIARCAIQLVAQR